MRPIFKLSLGQNGFEQLESRIFERITLHIDIDEGAYLAGAAKKRPKLRADMCDRIRGSSRTDLRIQSRDFDREIYYREELHVSPEWVRPPFRFAGQLL